MDVFIVGTQFFMFLDKNKLKHYLDDKQLLKQISGITFTDYIALLNILIPTRVEKFKIYE